VLREADAIAPAALPPLASHEQILEADSYYLREDRGLARKHLLFILLFLREVCLAAPAEGGGGIFLPMPIQCAQFVAWDACLPSCLFAIYGQPCIGAHCLLG